MSVATKRIVKRARIDYAMVFIFVLSLLLGGYVRISQLLPLHFPINDGGLFYAMTGDLQANGFHLPAFVSYNHTNIPFVYPPLGFYLAGFLSSLTGWSLLKIFQFLPAILATFSIPAFFLLARDLLKSKAVLALSTLIFALIPASSYWLIMGGGVTRSLGFLFSLLTLWSVLRMCTRPGSKYVILSAVLGMLTVLSHPESAIHTVVGALVIFLFLGRTKVNLVKSLIVAFTVIAFSSPWWASVIAVHGFSPFLAAFGTGGYRISVLLGFFQGNFAQETYLTFIGVLAVIGLFYELAKKRFFLLVWWLATILSEPRSAVLYFTPIVVILAAEVLADLVFPAINKLGSKPKEDRLQGSWADELLSGTLAKIAFTFFLVYFIMSAYQVPYEESRKLVVRDGDLTAFQWIKINLPSGKNFLLLTGDDPLMDPTSEWFPALTGENSLATIQGYEWIQNKEFMDMHIASANLQVCTVFDLQCLEDWKTQTGLVFDYVYVRKWQIKNESRIQLIPWPIQDSLMGSGHYELIYDSETTSIYKVQG